MANVIALTDVYLYHTHIITNGLITNHWPIMLIALTDVYLYHTHIIGLITNG